MALRVPGRLHGRDVSGEPVATTTAPADRRRDLLVVGALAILAFLLRAWALGRVGLGQYDEGVYALSALGTVDPGQPHRMWPSEALYAPPVYFLLVALSYLLHGPSDLAAVVVNVVLGSLLVPVAWWTGRSWFGRGAGLIAATLTALSEFQVVLSRSALTDVAFTLFFTIALVALVRAMEAGGSGRAVLAGLAAGLAWNTKYHGWFVLLIGGAALLAWVRAAGTGSGDARRALRAWLLASVVAVLCYLPWAVFIQVQGGGTAGWTRHYGQMLGTDWVGKFATHVANQYALEGPFTRASLPLGALVLVTAGALRPRSAPRFLLAVAALGAVALLLGGAAGMMLLGIGAVGDLLLRREDRARLATWVALGWAGLWFLAAPVYRPYFRLLLPLEIVTAVLAGVALERWLRADPSHASRRPGAGTLALAAAAVLAVFIVSRRLPDPTDPWRDGTALRGAATAMTAVIPVGAPVRVVWEPPVAYYLQLSGRQAFEDFTDEAVLDTISVDTYLVTGLYASRTPRFRDAMVRLADRLEVLGRYPVRGPTEVRVLDDLGPRRVRGYRGAPDSTFDLTLYLLRARPGPP